MALPPATLPGLLALLLAATALQAPSRELERHVGGRREVFYTSEQGIYYAGTFVGGAVADVPRAEYAQLPKHVRLLSRVFVVGCGADEFCGRR